MKYLIFLFSLFFLNLSLHAQWDVLNDGLVGNDITFTSKNVGWMWGYNELIKTEDGGETWQQILLDDNYWFREFFFKNDSLILSYVELDFAEDRLVLISENGGQSWSEFYHLAEDDYGLMDISIVNDSTIFMAGMINWSKGWIKKQLIMALPGRILLRVYLEIISTI